MDLATHAPPAQATTCRTHPTVAVSTFCSACVEPYCDVCLFGTPEGPACPECAVRPATGGRGRATAYSVASLVSAVLGVGLFILMGLYPQEGVAAQAAGLVSLSASVGGLAFALVARDHTRQRSPLMLVALILSSVLLVVYLGAVCFGMASGNA